MGCVVRPSPRARCVFFTGRAVYAQRLHMYESLGAARSAAHGMHQISRRCVCLCLWVLRRSVNKPSTKGRNAGNFQYKTARRMLERGGASVQSRPCSTCQRHAATQVQIQGPGAPLSRANDPAMEREPLLHVASGNLSFYWPDSASESRHTKRN